MAIQLGPSATELFVKQAAYFLIAMSTPPAATGWPEEKTEASGFAAFERTNKIETLQATRDAVGN
jgi:hypothetical protein